jgi:hypothetical protein
MRGISWLAWRPVSFSGRAILHGVSFNLHVLRQQTGRQNLFFLCVYLRTPSGTTDFVASNGGSLINDEWEGIGKVAFVTCCNWVRSVGTIEDEIWTQHSKLYCLTAQRFRRPASRSGTSVLWLLYRRCRRRLQNFPIRCAACKIIAPACELRRGGVAGVIGLISRGWSVMWWHLTVVAEFARLT